MKLWLSLFSSCLIISVTLHGIAYADIVKVGAEAPDFTLSSTKGKSFTLSAYRGIKPVIIWFSDCCGGCEGRAKVMQGLLEDYGIEILAISMLIKSHQTIEFADRIDVSFPFLIDTEFKVVKGYVGTYIPET
ncbi:MAG: redoxin domain-containing protein [Candidatus Brocadiaceae bacterium]|uniref:peroxiredoxin family protein n=1 Tax=Candidatus Wunengus sp. YC61 TaxID=3367698 RepID=UPI00271E52F1|nr:redoxin domain-containing protein [Candidatus Brocadiaceae bacterium]